MRLHVAEAAYTMVDQEAESAARSKSGRVGTLKPARSRLPNVPQHPNRNTARVQTFKTLAQEEHFRFKT